MSHLPAVAGDAVLDNKVLGHEASQWDIELTELRIVERLATGRAIERTTRAPVGEPLIITRRTFVIDWDHLEQGARAQVEQQLSLPGEHRLVLWREEQLAWLGDGNRTIYILPNRWQLALHVVSTLLPGGVPAAAFEPVVSVGGVDATYALVANVAAAAPPAGQVHFEDSTSRFRLPSAPAPGTPIYARVVPAYPVFRGAPVGKQLRGPLREPHQLELIEA